MCDRNTSIGAKGLWERGSEPIKRFGRYSRFWEGRELVEEDKNGGRSKSTRTEISIAAVAEFVKIDCRIASRMIAESLNTPKTLVLRIPKEYLWREFVYTFCSTLLDTWAKGRSSHILPRHYRDGRCGQIIFLTKLLWEMRLGVSPMTPKFGETSPQPKQLKFQKSCIKTMLIIFSILKAQCTMNSYRREKQ